MNFDWYNIFNLTEFTDELLISRSLTVFLEGRGEQEILITRGNVISIVYEDVIMPIEYLDENPFVREGDDAHYAVYKDSNEDVWLGIEVEE
jgi:hypothetical protein